MAKSLRSKWRRKCRAVKRIRYGQKELERLKKTLGIDDSQNKVNMSEIVEVATVTDAKTVKENVGKKDDQECAVSMETDSKRTFNPKTLRDQHGTYPVWMHQRKIRKHKKVQKKLKGGR